MELEMVNNQGILLGASSLLRRYRSVTKAEIEVVPPPPDGPPLANMKR